ncbi:hypothetical protein [Microbacterium kunmingense]|uniref:hypothetical protein n=1 Tax=Microbacterium kunmingense TaxID=2915939 RepID=UPI002003990B|nr:hypothetical protein [Microbacterium kunmingense]
MARPDTPLLSEADILSAALAALTERLPSDWRADIQREPAIGRYRADAVVMIIAPGGASAALYAEVKRSLVTKDLPGMVEQTQAYIEADTAPRRDAAKPLIIARYLAPPLQHWLTEREIPYADATGNIRISLREPALFVRDVGAQRDPWRGPGRPKGNLTGPSAARIVRALVDFRPPYTVPALMKLAGTPSGNTYRAVDFIEQQDLLSRADNGTIVDVRWRALLERWSKDYSFATLAVGNTYLAPRGLPDLMNRLAGLHDDDVAGRYAVTGSMATPRWEAYAPARNAMIYAEKPNELAARADLRPVEAGANVLIANADATAAFDRTEQLGGAVVVGPSQAAIDLLTAPGRGPEEGHALLNWMEKHELDWRQ